MATALPLPLHASPASHFPAQQHGCWERRGGGSRGLEIPVPAVLQVRHLPSSCIWSSHNHCSDFSATVSSICSSSHSHHSDFASTLSSIHSSHKHRFDFSPTVCLCVSMPPAVYSFSCRKVDVGLLILTCTMVIVQAVHRKVR